MELILTPYLYFEGNFLQMWKPGRKLTHCFTCCIITTHLFVLKHQELKVILTQTGFVKKYYQAYKRHLRQPRVKPAGF